MYEKSKWAKGLIMKSLAILLLLSLTTYSYADAISDYLASLQEAEHSRSVPTPFPSFNVASPCNSSNENTDVCVFKKSRDELFRAAVATSEGDISTLQSMISDEEPDGFNVAGENSSNRLPYTPILNSNDPDEFLNNPNAILPKNLYNEYYSLAQGMVKRGFTSPAILEDFKSTFGSTFNRNSDGSWPTVTVPAPPAAPIGTTLKDYLGQQYKGLTDYYLENIKANPLSCNTENGSLLAYQRCCAGLDHVQVNENNLAANACESPVGGKCKKSYEKCETNGECYSGFCEKRNEDPENLALPSPDDPGYCAPTRTCMKPRQVGETCTQTSYYCLESTCAQINGALKCTDCVGRGKRPINGKVCCPGKVEVKDKNNKPICVDDIVPIQIAPPLEVKSLFEDGQTSFLYKIINIVFPSAYAEEGDEEDEPKSLTEAQRDLINQGIGRCESVFARGSTDFEQCVAGVNRQKENFLNDAADALTVAQLQEIKAAEEVCLQGPEEDEASCLEGVNELKKGFIAKNEEEGVSGGVINKEDYLKQYDTAMVSAKTYSDPKQCEFRSFNDSWRTASNQEKNAEIFMRAFEYVYSGEGAEDYWDEVDDGKNLGNIFTRAKSLGKRFRENRYLSIKKYQELDKKMKCKCIAIFGPQKFDTTKQAFFNSSCEDEQIELRKQLGRNCGENATGPCEESNIDGSKIDGDKNKVAQDQSEYEEVDKGAIGISQEKLLLEWLQARAKIQAELFTDNSDLEEEAKALSDYIAQEDYLEVYQDRIAGKQFIDSDPKGDSVPVYGWKIKYYKGWVVEFVRIVAFTSFGTLAFVVKDAFDLNKDKRGGRLDTIKNNFDKDSITSEASIAGFDAAYAEKFPILGDQTLYKGKSAGTFKKKDAYLRYYLGPRYESPSKKCSIPASASSCVKTFYKTTFNGKTHYLLDPLRPMFVPPEKIKIDGVEGLNKDWVTLIKETRDSAIKYFTQSGPFRNNTPTSSVKRVSKSFGGRDYLTAALKENHFLVLKGQMQDPTLAYLNAAGSARGLDKRQAIIAGARKYALCKKLKDCGSTDEAIDAIGFGFLFESETEAQNFAEYTYKLHYHWANLSEEGMLGYPKVGQDAYFRSVAYSLKVLGSLAQNRANNLAEAIQVFKADLEARISNYDSIDGATIGRASRNVEFGERFLAEFRAISFDGAVSSESFSERTNAIGDGTGNFSSAEIEALGAARNSAIRKQQDKKALTELKESRKKSTKGGNISARNSAINSVLKDLNNPIATVRPKGLGGGTRNALASINDSIDALNENIDKINNRKAKNFDTKTFAPKSFGFGGFKSPSTFSSSYEDEIDGSLAANDQPFSPSQADRIIDALNNNKKKMETSESDTLFTRVSKAYKRNLSRVLKRASVSTKAGDIEKKSKKKELNSEQKSLKRLLERT